MNIWLDDMRQAPDGWAHVRNLDDLKGLVKKLGRKFEIDVMSFDYNLGYSENGLDVMKYLADMCVRKKTPNFWPKEIRYHSNDPRGVEEMQSFAMTFQHSCHANP